MTNEEEKRIADIVKGFICSYFGCRYEHILKALDRIDKLNEGIASHLLWTLISNSSSDEEIKRREKAYDEMDQLLKDKDFLELSNKCEFFNNPDNWKYNTFNMVQALCTGDKEQYKDIPELVSIADYLNRILVALS